VLRTQKVRLMTGMYLRSLRFSYLIAIIFLNSTKWLVFVTENLFYLIRAFVLE